MDEPVRIISGDLVLVDWGPMTMTISAWQAGEPCPVMAAQAARIALENLSVLSDFQQYMKKPARDLDPGRFLPPVVRRALDAVLMVSAELTPLAAVAGAGADEAADLAAGLGADRVIVNNGGDIALRLAPEQSAVVGVKPPGEGENLWGKLSAQGPEIGGVASSGWQGRSFSPGAADLVTVWARSAALADAAATWLAGRVDVQSPAIKRAPARQLDAGTDLGDTQVTERVGDLSAEEKRAALEAGQAEALKLYEQGIICGCVMVVQGDAAWLDREGRLQMKERV